MAASGCIAARFCTAEPAERETLFFFDEVFFLDEALFFRVVDFFFVADFFLADADLAVREACAEVCAGAATETIGEAVISMAATRMTIILYEPDFIVR